MRLHFNRCKEMYEDITRTIDDLTPKDRDTSRKGWYQFNADVIGLSDQEANKILWYDDEMAGNIDWYEVAEELKMLYGDTASIEASVNDELGVF